MRMYRAFAAPTPTRWKTRVGDPGRSAAKPITLRPWVIALVVVGALTLDSRELFAQCAMCRRALQSPEGLQMIAALRHGILFLLAAPFASFAAVAFLAIRRQRRRAHHAAESIRGGQPS